jgi:hypothetical protein
MTTAMATNSPYGAPLAEARLRVISLGAGVQSSTLALMARDGEIGPMPDAAIFADTQGEAGPTYRHLDWLSEQLPFPVYRVTKGNLEREILEACEGKNGAWGRPPFYVDNGGNQVPQLAWDQLPLAGGEERLRVRGRRRRQGITRRQCTQDYKLEPIWKKVRELAGLKPRSPGPHAAIVEQWIGISWDERIRIRPAEQRWIHSRWPLLELQMTREDCERWLVAHGYPIPPKSACRFCPLRSTPEWRRLREDSPEDFEAAVALDARLRNGAQHIGLKGTLYLHRSLQPLGAVDLATREDKGQHNFMNECHGICGV